MDQPFPFPARLFHVTVHLPVRGGMHNRLPRPPSGGACYQHDRNYQ
jgi:hypothetical protein